MTGAKNEYQTLKRELSQMSRRSSPSKAEEGQADSEDFNLDDFLHGIHREQEENGQKRKHLGVSWKNLHVEVNIAVKLWWKLRMSSCMNFVILGFGRRRLHHSNCIFIHHVCIKVLEAVQKERC